MLYIYIPVMYNEAARFISLLKFDFQVTLTLLILVLRNGIQIDLLEKIVLGVGIPFSLIWVLLGYIAVSTWSALSSQFRWIYSQPYLTQTHEWT